MATERQLAANRRNAEKSTGPRTQQGKARSRMNALRHGFAAADAGLRDSSSLEELERWLQQTERETAAGLASLEHSIDLTSAPELIARAVKRTANLERYKARIFSAWKKKLREELKRET